MSENQQPRRPGLVTYLPTPKIKGEPITERPKTIAPLVPQTSNPARVL